MVFSRIWTFEFTSWDDESHILHNPFLQNFSFESLKVILTPGKMPDEQLYIPFTYISYFIESSCFGIKASVFHIDNLLLHLLNAILVYSFSLLIIKNGYGALICALFFAVHPLQVEAVAWTMGRKDLLMTLFSLLTLINFTCFINNNSSKAWVLSLICFFAAVFSKPSAFVLPLLFPVLSWHFGRKLDKDLILKILPFFAISAITCLINSKIEMNSFGHELKFILFRTAFIPSIAEDWCLKILLLSKPTAYYSWYDYYQGNCITIAGLTVAISFMVVATYAYLRKIKILFTGLSFLIILFIPAAILISWSFRDFVTADRYGYLPLIGVFLLAGSALQISGSNIFKLIFACAISICIITAAWKAFGQVAVWRNSETLWKSVLKEHDDSYTANYNLGNYYFKNKNDLPLAEFHYRRANSISPDSDAWFNLGIICELTRRKDESSLYYGRAVFLDPNSSCALRKLALACYQKNDLDNALKYFLRLAELSPDSAETYFYCGKIFEIKGEREMAAKAFRYFERLKQLNNKN
jgi:tetratricopeptide (TPR) repeat protein